MLRPRIIPCLLIHKGGLVKTRQFGEPRYVGDPLNAVRIFNEKQADELVVLDIDATRHGHAPNEQLIAHLAAECRMPLCYGGGVRSPEMVERLVSLGVEKVAISSAAIADGTLITRAASRVGSQSVVVVLDVKSVGLFGRKEVVTHNGTRMTGEDPVSLARRMQDAGAGEILINSVDRDGMMQGYDMGLVDNIRGAIKVPLTILGGAGSMDHVRELVGKYPIIGAAAGSLYVFKGKYRAVLINYPSLTERDALVAHARAQVS